MDLFDDTVEKAFARLDRLSDKWGKKYRFIGKLYLDETNELYFTYIHYHPKIRRMVYTTNWIERLNKDFRRTFKIRNSMPPQRAGKIFSALAIAAIIR